MSSRELSFSTTRVPPGRRALRVVMVLLGLALTALLAWAVIVGLLWGYAWIRLGADDVPALQDDVAVLGPSGARAPTDATTVLVTLTGSVDPTVPRPPELEGPVVLVQVGGPRGEPAALALPRELPVTVDGLGELSLAEVQAEGGADLLVRAVADYSAVRVDHVASLSIDALPELVDAAGPLEVCRATGCAQTTGEQLRAELASASEHEVSRLVADVARALGQRLDRAFAVRSPFASRRVVDVVADEITTDVSLRGARLLEVAAALGAPVRLDDDILPLVFNPETGEIVPLAEPAVVRFQRLQDGDPLRAEGESGGTAELEADMVAAASVAVLNGAGVDGLAGRVQAELETAGFDVVGTGNANAFDRSETVVNYSTDDPTAEFVAVRLSEQLGGAALEPLAQRPDFEGEAVDLLVTVGEDRAN